MSANNEPVTYGMKFTADSRALAASQAYMDSITRLIENAKKEVLYQAVKATGDWTTVRLTVESIQSEPVSLTWRVKATARAVEQSQVRIYVPVEVQPGSLAGMPKDTYRCNYCGGWTKNDKRGNCGACGAPRSDDAWIPK